jgi:hypothetical protein
MRRSTEKMLAVQLLTVTLAVTGLLLAQLTSDTRRPPSPAHALTWHSIAAGIANPWHAMKRLVRRVTDRPAHEATPAPQPATEMAENSRAP